MKEENRNRYAIEEKTSLFVQYYTVLCVSKQKKENIQCTYRENGNITVIAE